MTRAPSIPAPSTPDRPEPDAPARIEWVELDWQGRTVQVEHSWVGPAQADTAPIVFLHEGLGSLSMWRDFPARLCAAVGRRGLVYSRPGYGRSTPRAPGEHWAPNFMHRQAHELLPALLASLGVCRAPWLFGHSDGGSIALLHAARFAAQGVIVMAPHIFVEDLSLRSIEQARLAYQHTDLRQRLARHHDDPDSAFFGWNCIWLHPDFRAWNIEGELHTIRCPLLAVQGLQDEYGTLEQVRGIARCVPQAQLLELPGCGHSPHKDQPAALLRACADFMRLHGASPG